MALASGALTVKTGEAPGAPTFVVSISFDGDDSYPTGGTLAFQQFVRNIVTGTPSLEIVDVISGDCGNHKAEYLKGTDALKVRLISTGAEVANSTDLSSTTFNLTVLAR